MGGDFGETVLKTDRPELPDALIFGDSFTNALETLLYASFDETRILDLRHYTDMSLKEYVDTYRPDVVLCIQNDTFYYTAGGNQRRVGGMSGTTGPGRPAGPWIEERLWQRKRGKDQCDADPGPEKDPLYRPVL